jgi:hypothetical protein
MFVEFNAKGFSNSAKCIDHFHSSVSLSTCSCVIAEIVTRTGAGTSSFLRKRDGSISEIFMV